MGLSRIRIRVTYVRALLNIYEISKTLSFYLGSNTTIIIVVHIQSKLFKKKTEFSADKWHSGQKQKPNIKRIFYMKFNSDLVAIGLKRVKKDDKKMDSDLCLRLHHKKINSEKANEKSK